MIVSHVTRIVSSFLYELIKEWQGCPSIRQLKELMEAVSSLCREFLLSTWTTLDPTAWVTVMRSIAVQRQAWLACSRTALGGTGKTNEEVLFELSPCQVPRGQHWWPRIDLDLPWNGYCYFSTKSARAQRWGQQGFKGRFRLPPRRMSKLRNSGLGSTRVLCKQKTSTLREAGPMLSAAGAEPLRAERIQRGQGCGQASILTPCWRGRNWARRFGKSGAMVVGELCTAFSLEIHVWASTLRLPHARISSIVYLVKL